MAPHPLGRVVQDRHRGKCVGGTRTARRGGFSPRGQRCQILPASSSLYMSLMCSIWPVSVKSKHGIPCHDARPDLSPSNPNSPVSNSESSQTKPGTSRIWFCPRSCSARSASQFSGPARRRRECYYSANTPSLPVLPADLDPVEELGSDLVRRNNSRC